MQTENFAYTEPPVVTLNPMGAFLAASMVGALGTLGVMALWASAMRNATTGSLTINFPFANGFTQLIDPSTNWGIVGATDHPSAERAILDGVGSYGKQLGRMMDVVRDLAARVEDADPEKREALEDLARRIDEIKKEHGLAT